MSTSNGTKKRIRNPRKEWQWGVIIATIVTIMMVLSTAILAVTFQSWKNPTLWVQVLSIAWASFLLFKWKVLPGSMLTQVALEAMKQKTSTTNQEQELPIRGRVFIVWHGRYIGYINILLPNNSYKRLKGYSGQLLEESMPISSEALQEIRNSLISQPIHKFNSLVLYPKMKFEVAICPLHLKSLKIERLLDGGLIAHADSRNCHNGVPSGGVSGNLTDIFSTQQKMSIWTEVRDLFSQEEADALYSLMCRKVSKAQGDTPAQGVRRTVPLTQNTPQSGMKGIGSQLNNGQSTIYKQHSSGNNQR